MEFKILTKVLKILLDLSKIEVFQNTIEKYLKEWKRNMYKKKQRKIDAFLSRYMDFMST